MRSDKDFVRLGCVGGSAEVGLAGASTTTTTVTIKAVLLF